MYYDAQAEAKIYFMTCPPARAVITAVRHSLERLSALTRELDEVMAKVYATSVVSDSSTSPRG